MRVPGRALARVRGPLFWTPRGHPGEPDARTSPGWRAPLGSADWGLVTASRGTTALTAAGRGSSGHLYCDAGPRGRCCGLAPGLGNLVLTRAIGVVSRAVVPPVGLCPRRHLSSDLSHSAPRMAQLPRFQPREAGWTLLTLPLGLMVQGRPQSLRARWPEAGSDACSSARAPGLLLGPLPGGQRGPHSGGLLCRLVWHLGLGQGQRGLQKVGQEQPHIGLRVCWAPEQGWGRLGPRVGGEEPGWVVGAWWRAPKGPGREGAREGTHPACRSHRGW